MNLLHSPSLRASGVFGLAGVALAAANLILARGLATASYGRFTLAFAILSLGLQLAPAGIEGPVNRKRLRGDTTLLRRALASSIPVALVVVGSAQILYGLDSSLAAILLCGAIAGGTNAVAAAVYQSKQSFWIALTLTQVASIVLLPTALAGLALPLPDEHLPIGVLALGYSLAALASWTALLRPAEGRDPDSDLFRWSEALAYAGVQWAGLVLTLLERLLIPKLLAIEDLATYGVLASVTIAPFRMLQLGIGYTLLPRLAAARELGERRRLIRREALTMAIVITCGAAAVWSLAPLVVDLLLGDRYDLPMTLVMAAIFNGVLRVASGFARATVSALCTNRELSALNLWMWAFVGVAAIGAAIGSRWGLEGIVYGTAAGWAGRILASAFFSWRHLGNPAVGAPTRG